MNHLEFERDHRASLERFTRKTFLNGLLCGLVIGATIVGIAWLWS